MNTNQIGAGSEVASKLTLDANPGDAPCCVKLEDSEGRSILFQTDWGWPSVASLFGFSVSSVQKCGKCGHVSTNHHNEVVKYCRECETNVGAVCHHGSDGTVDCVCGVTAGQFIQAAREWLDDHDGETCENPGYELTEA